MAQSKKEILDLLSGAQMRPRHRFGQNFMIDQNLVRVIAGAADLRPGDAAIEVGPGTGTLTEEILARGASLFAVEIDRDLAALLRARFASEPRLTLVESDALCGKHHLAAPLADHIASLRACIAAPKLVANLPYNIASPLVIELLIAGVETLCFTVQREVAQRLSARVGDELYSALSVMAQLLADVEILRTIPAQAFWPAPGIESALVRMRRRDQLGPAAPAFSDFLHGVFAYRRKRLSNSLALAGHDALAILAATGVDGSLRPEEIGVGEWLAMHRAAGPRPA